MKSLKVVIQVLTVVIQVKVQGRERELEQSMAVSHRGVLELHRERCGVSIGVSTAMS